MRALLGLALVLAPMVASAQLPPDPPPPPPSPGWSEGHDRWFTAGLIDIGPLYLRPRVSAGWGKPFHRWVGVDTNPLISGEGIGAYGGARVSTPWADLRIGARAFSTFSRSVLEPRHFYNRLAIEVRDGPKSRYLSLEAELTANLPVGPGKVLVVLTGTYVAIVPDDFYVYEDTLKMVVAPPWAWVARTGYELAFASMRRARVAAVVELAGSPERDLLVLRGGVTGSLRLGNILELRAALVPALLSRDALGAMGGQWFEIGLRFRFATGAPADLQLPSL